jgi:diaminopimelate epimerase
MQGSGNDFVLLFGDDLGLSPSAMPDWARAICKRAFGVGADGLIILESAPDDPQVDYRWHFYNADGSRAEMCGNGSRCAARLAFESGFAPASHVMGTDAGPVRAEVLKDHNEVAVQLTRPRELELSIRLQDSGWDRDVHSVNTGVPHAVLFSEQADHEDLAQLGPWLRYHLRFAPHGCNVNIVQPTEEGLYLRTYERGVEDETYACGTGAVAAAYIARALERAGDSINITTSGGERLAVSFRGEDAFLQGAATFVYQAELNCPALGLSL